jgi:molybdopterin-containing oxidoreductase family molybdopterin binding subunit
VRTVCPHTCGLACGILAHVKDGVLVKVEPGDFPGTSHICHRGLAAMKHVYHPDRLKYPVKRVGERGEGKWERISWDEALDTIAVKLGEIGDKYGSSSFAWAMDMLGVIAVSSYVGMVGACQGTFIGLVGMGDSAGPSNDLVCYGAPYAYGESYTMHFDNPAFCLIWGNNPAETDFFKWRRIRDARERGVRVVVIDPKFTTTASKADEYLQIRPGTDGALALGMINVILDKGLHDISFITKHTVGPFLVRIDNGMFLREKDISSGGSDKYMVWDTPTDTARSYDMPETSPALTGAYKVQGIDCKPAFQLLLECVHEYSPDRASEITELPADTIRRLAIEYATAKPAASYRGMGCQRTFHGDLTYHAINSLAAVTGNISVEGHAPFVTNRAVFLTRGFPKPLPLLNMYEAILNDKPYPIRALWIARHNLVNQDPDFNKILNELLPRLELFIVADIFMSVSAKYADIVLPACTSYECTDLISPAGNGSHNYLQLQQKVIEPLYESRSDFDAMVSLARRMGMDGYMDKSAEEYCEAILASGHPSMEGITMQKLQEGPLPTAPHSVPDFATPSGRLEFYVESLKGFDQQLPVYLEPLESNRGSLAEKYPLCFLATHTKYRTHSMFANIPWLRELAPEPKLDVNPVDAKARRIQDGDLVRVFNDRGEVKLRARVHSGVRQGLVSTSQGWAPRDYVSGTHQALTHATINLAQQAAFEPNASYHDVLVEVEPVKEG